MTNHFFLWVIFYPTENEHIRCTLMVGVDDSFPFKTAPFQQTFIQPSIYHLPTINFQGTSEFSWGGYQQNNNTKKPFNEKWTHIFSCNTTFGTSLASGSVKSTLGASSSDSTVKGGVGAPTASPQGQGTVVKATIPK